MDVFKNVSEKSARLLWKAFANLKDFVLLLYTQLYTLALTFFEILFQLCKKVLPYFQVDPHKLVQVAQDLINANFITKFLV
eukprot:Awhi_evm1s6944